MKLLATLLLALVALTANAAVTWQWHPFASDAGMIDTREMTSFGMWALGYHEGESGERQLFRFDCDWATLQAAMDSGVITTLGRSPRATAVYVTAIRVGFDHPKLRNARVDSPKTDAPMALRAGQRVQVRYDLRTGAVVLTPQ